MIKMLTLGLLLFCCLIGYSQTTKDSCELKVRVFNKSKYHINKLIINKSIITDSLDSNNNTNFICVQSLFTSLNYDITFTKKSLFVKTIWAHIISQPIDYNGEKEVKQGQFDLFLTIDKISRDKYDIEFKRK